MKNKIECLITSILIVLSFVFITWSIGFIIPRYWVTIAFLVYGIYLIYGILNPKKNTTSLRIGFLGEIEDGYSSHAMSLKSGKRKRL